MKQMAVKIINIVESLLFSSDSPLSVKEIKDIINEEKEFSGVTADIKGIESSISELKARYENNEYTFRLIEVAGAYRFATKKEYSIWLAKLNKEKLKRKLSQSALETLSIIAYNQPITRSEIEGIRGVNVDYIVGSLLEKDVITMKGRSESPGRPMLFGTTDRFLEYLGLDSLEQLPPLKEISEIIKSGPPEGVTQSDIDFFEEINQMRAKGITEESDNPDDLPDKETDDTPGSAPSASDY
jgi:segregation and condensation protein B